MAKKGMGTGVTKEILAMVGHLALAAQANPKNDRVNRWYGNMQTLNAVYSNNPCSPEIEAFILQRAYAVYDLFLQIEEDLLV